MNISLLSSSCPALATAVGGGPDSEETFIKRTTPAGGRSLGSERICQEDAATKVFFWFPRWGDWVAVKELKFRLPYYGYIVNTMVSGLW